MSRSSLRAKTHHITYACLHTNVETDGLLKARREWRLQLAVDPKSGRGVSQVVFIVCGYLLYIKIRLSARSLGSRALVLRARRLQAAGRHVFILHIHTTHHRLDVTYIAVKRRGWVESVPSQFFRAVDGINKLSMESTNYRWNQQTIDRINKLSMGAPRTYFTTTIPPPRPLASPLNDPPPPPRITKILPFCTVTHATRILLAPPPPPR